MKSCVIALFVMSCEPAPQADAPMPDASHEDGSPAETVAPQDGPARFVAEAIERHGGSQYERSRVRFTFRDFEFEIERDGGHFRYERRYADDQGRPVVEIMDNEGTRMEVGGERVELDPEELRRVETDVNSVVYFSFLPFRLLEPAANHRELGETEIEGEPYRMIEVTFDPDGGGTDWQDRFVHWIHRDENTLDYFAYRYHRDGGGARFRRAVNRREVGGLLIQDFENFRALQEPVADIAEFGQLLEEGGLELLSLLVLEDVQVMPLR